MEWHILCSKYNTQKVGEEVSLENSWYHNKSSFCCYFVCFAFILAGYPFNGEYCAGKLYPICSVQCKNVHPYPYLYALHIWNFDIAPRVFLHSYLVSPASVWRNLKPREQKSLLVEKSSPLQPDTWNSYSALYTHSTEIVTYFRERFSYVIRSFLPDAPLHISIDANM